MTYVIYVFITKFVKNEIEKYISYKNIKKLQNVIELFKKKKTN